MSDDQVNTPAEEAAAVETDAGGWTITIPSTSTGTISGTGTTGTGTIYIGGGGGGGNAGYTSIPLIGGWYTFTVPVSTDPNTVPDIDLAVSVPDKTNKPQGYVCKKCSDFCEYAECNQRDGSFVCYSCRTRW